MCKCLYTIYIIAMASNTTSSLSEDNTSGTNLSLIPTEDEKQIDTTNWMPAKRKKLQHMKNSMRNTSMSLAKEHPFAP